MNPTYRLYVLIIFKNRIFIENSFCIYYFHRFRDSGGSAFRQPGRRILRPASDRWRLRHRPTATTGRQQRRRRSGRRRWHHTQRGPVHRFTGCTANVDPGQLRTVLHQADRALPVLDTGPELGRDVRQRYRFAWRLRARRLVSHGHFVDGRVRAPGPETRVPRESCGEDAVPRRVQRGPVAVGVIRPGAAGLVRGQARWGRPARLVVR